MQSIRRNITVIWLFVVAATINGYSQNQHKVDSVTWIQITPSQYQDAINSQDAFYKQATRKGDSILSIFKRRQFNTVVVPQDLTASQFKDKEIKYDSLLDIYEPEIKALEVRNEIRSSPFADSIINSNKIFVAIDNQIKMLMDTVQWPRALQIEKGIDSNIEKLPPSLAKLILLLARSSFAIKQENYRIGFISSIITSAGNIKIALFNKDSTKLYDLALADILIADFATYYTFIQSAIIYYYEALRFIEDGESISQFQKNYVQAYIYARMGYIYRELNLEASTFKSFLFFSDAVKFYAKAKRITEGYDIQKNNPVAFPWYVDTILGIDPFEEAWTETTHYSRMTDLADIVGNSSIDIISGKYRISPFNGCLLFFSIAKILGIEDLQKDELRFYQLFLIEALKTKDCFRVCFALNTVADWYSKNRYSTQAFKYLNISATIANTSDDRALYVTTIIKKAKLYEESMTYDSALYFLTTAQNIFSIQNPPQHYIYQNLAVIVFQAKARIFTIFNEDSSQYYERLSQKEIGYLHSSYTNLLAAEAYSINTSTKVLDDKVLKIEQDKRAIAEFDKELFRRIDKLEKDTAQMYLERAAVAEAHKAIVDSLNLDIQYKDKKIQEKGKQIENRNQDLIGQKMSLIISMCAVGILSIFSIVLLVKNNKKSKSLARLKQRVINLKNRIGHELKNMIEIVPELLLTYQNKQIDRDLTFSKIVEYSDKIKNFARLHLNSDVGVINTLQNEIILAEDYLFYFLLLPSMKGYKIKITNCVADEYLLMTLPIPIYLMTNFIMNAIKHGCADRSQKEIDIWIRSEKTTSGFFLIVEDSGCGINYSKRIGGTSTGQGFELVNGAIEGFNSTNSDYRIKFSKESIIDRSDFGENGTRVTIEYINLQS